MDKKIEETRRAFNAMRRRIPVHSISKEDVGIVDTALFELEASRDVVKWARAFILRTKHGVLNPFKEFEKALAVYDKVKK